jgi:hypothetical protein
MEKQVVIVLLNTQAGPGCKPELPGKTGRNYQASISCHLHEHGLFPGDVRIQGS